MSERHASTTDTSRTALLLGATGLVGGHVLRALLDDETWSRVIVLGRRSVGIESPKLDEHLIDFEALETHAERFAVDDVFSCLGTTIKKAGSEDAFRQVDYIYPFETARLAEAGGAEQLLLVSSLGANPEARSFYLRVKGELERNLSRLAFRTTCFFRPSILLGARDERRPLETFMAGLASGLWWLMIGPLGRFRPIEAKNVAAAMVAVARRRRPGKHVIESDEIRRIAHRADETMSDD